MKNMPYDEKKNTKIKIMKKIKQRRPKTAISHQKKDKHFYGCALITKNG